MDLFLIIAILLGLTALFGVVNERYLRLQSAIGLMLLALLTTLVLVSLKSIGLVDDLGWEETLVRELDLSNVLLNGVLCFMLFAGSAGVKMKLLRERKWVILSLVIGSTLLACLLTGVLLSMALGWFGITLPIAILVCLIARAVSVFVPITALDATPVLDANGFGMTKLLTWGGLRGGLALALALSLPQSPEKPLILNMTFGIVTFSILVQRWTIGKLFKPSYLQGLMKSG